MKKLFLFLVLSLMMIGVASAVTINVPGDQPTIQSAITAATAGDTIEVAAGTYVEGPQIVINKNLDIIGADKNTVIIKPSADTGSSGDARGWFLVNVGKTFNLQKVTLDGSEKKVFQAIRYNGFGSVSDCVIKNIKHSTYLGMGIAAMGNSDVDVTNCEFSNIERLGIIYFGTGITTNSVASGNTYIGKGEGDWLDYGIEVGGSAQATISNNQISSCKGVASVDGSTSAGILVTTYYGAGTAATITGNTISDSSEAIAIGYDASDTSSVVAHNNKFIGSGLGSTNPSVNAENNYWGAATGPNTAGASTADIKIDFAPYYTDAVMTTLSTSYSVCATGCNFVKIQDAVNAASAGDTINVAAGTYDEQVVINKALTLQGVGDTTVIKPSSAAKLTSLYTLGTQDGALWSGKKLASIISVSNTNNVIIENLKVDGESLISLPTGADYVVGVSYGETGGTVSNIKVVNMNKIPENIRTYGIWLDAVSNPVSVEVKNSAVELYNKNGINSRGAKLTINIHDNSVTGPEPDPTPTQYPNGIGIVSGATGIVAKNTVTNIQTPLTEYTATGIFSYDTSNVKIEDNIISEALTGIALSGSPTTGGTGSSTVQGNTIFNCGVGIQLESPNTANNIINNNIIHDNTEEAIYLNGPDGNGPQYSVGAGNEAHFNNIYANVLGVENDNPSVTFNASNNWWGDNSGPYHATTNPTGLGDGVSNYVIYSPWISQGSTDNNVNTIYVSEGVYEADVITTGTNTEMTITTNEEQIDATVSVVRLDTNPTESTEGLFVIPGLNVYVDISTDIPDEEITGVTLRIYYNEEDLVDTPENSLQPYWWNPETEAWEAIADYIVNTANNYIEFTVDHLSLFTIAGTEGNVGGEGADFIALTVPDFIDYGKLYGFVGFPSQLKDIVLENTGSLDIIVTPIFDSGHDVFKYIRFGEEEYVGWIANGACYGEVCDLFSTYIPMEVLVGEYGEPMYDEYDNLLFSSEKPLWTLIYLSGNLEGEPWPVDEPWVKQTLTGALTGTVLFSAEEAPAEEL